MWAADDYWIESEDPSSPEVANRAFDLAWRRDFSAPGFCAIDPGSTPDSKTLRSMILGLKEQLDELARRHSGSRFSYRTVGRFDQQSTTRFHLDGAPDRSMLMLGYEPSEVESRLSIADYTRCAFDLGIEPRQFLDDFNPMYRAGEDRLAGYITTLPSPLPGHSLILVINNSALPYSPGGSDPLGVLHRGVIDAPDPSKRRIINSMMLASIMHSDDDREAVDRERIDRFASTQAISGNV